MAFPNILDVYNIIISDDVAAMEIQHNYNRFTPELITVMMKIATDHNKLDMLKYLHKIGGDLKSNDNYVIKTSIFLNFINILDYAVDNGGKITANIFYEIKNLGIITHLVETNRINLDIIDPLKIDKQYREYIANAKKINEYQNLLIYLAKSSIFISPDLIDELKNVLLI